jgi:hypothetical protein
MSNSTVTIVLAIIPKDLPGVYELRVGRDAVPALLAGGRQWLLAGVEEIEPGGLVELTFLGTKPAVPVLVAAEPEPPDASHSSRGPRRRSSRPGEGPSGTAA